MSDMLNDALAEMDRQLGIESEPGDEPEAEASEGAPDEGGTPEPAEPEVAEQPADDGQPRDEQGRFAPKEGEPAEEEPAVAAVEPPDEKFVSYLGRFGIDAATLGELPEAAQKAVRAGFEADSMVGTRGREYGELKKELEQLRETVSQPREPEPVPQQITQDMVDEDPMSATLLAYEQNNQHALQVAFAAWKDEDPATAGAWAATKASEQQLAHMNEQWQARYAELEQRVAPLAQSADHNSFAAAWQAVKDQHPDADKYAAKIQEAIDQAPEIAQALATGTADDKQRVLANLYKITAFDAGRQAETLLTDAAKTAEERQAQEAKAAKQEAFVGSGSQRNEPEPISDDERWLQENFDPAAARYMAPDEG